jgi:hypothetical protein
LCSNINIQLRRAKYCELYLREFKMAAVKSSGRNAAFEDLSNVEFETSEDVEVIDQFKNMHLKEELLRGVFAYGKKCRRNLGQQMRL